MRHRCLTAIWGVDDSFRLFLIKILLAGWPGSQNRKRSVFFLQNDFCQHHDKVQLYVIWCVVKINLRKLKCFNYFERSKLYDLLQQLFELQSSLCVLDKAQRIGCFFTVSPNFQYQNENWLVANQKHSFKKSSLLAQQVFSYWYRNLGGTVKNALYDVQYPRRRLLWTSKSCCTVAVFSYDQLILVRTIGWVS